jgi:flagellar assembly protein FliH
MSGLTAWERWELASFDQPAEAAQPNETADAAAAVAGENDRIRDQAQSEGYTAGYAAGRAAAQEEATRLGRLADELERSLAEFQQQVADELLALALEIARQVVRREISARPETILEVVREALAQLPHQHAVIYLSGADMALVRNHMGEVLAHGGHRLHEDPQLKAGDCLIETGGSQVDAALATRWRRVIESIGLESAWQDPPPP